MTIPPYYHNCFNSLEKLYSKNETIDNQRLRMMISALVDKSLGGIKKHKESQNEFKDDNGSNLITFVATLESYHQRAKFWTSKLNKLFLESNSQ